MLESENYINPIITQDLYSPCDGTIEAWDDKYKDVFRYCMNQELAIIRPSSSILYAPCSGIITYIVSNNIRMISDSGIEIFIKIKNSKILNKQWVEPLIPEGIRVECHQPIMNLNKKVYHRDCLIGILYEKNRIFLNTNTKAFTKISSKLLKTGKVTYHDKIAELITKPFSESSLEKIRKAGIKRTNDPLNHLYILEEFEDIITPSDEIIW